MGQLQGPREYSSPLFGRARGTGLGRDPNTSPVRQNEGNWLIGAAFLKQFLPRCKEGWNTTARTHPERLLKAENPMQSNSQKQFGCAAVWEDERSYYDYIPTAQLRPMKEMETFCSEAPSDNVTFIWSKLDQVHATIRPEILFMQLNAGSVKSGSEPNVIIDSMERPKRDTKAVKPRNHNLTALMLLSGTRQTESGVSTVAIVFEMWHLHLSMYFGNVKQFAIILHFATTVTAQVIWMKSHWRGNYFCTIGSPFWLGQESSYHKDMWVCKRDLQNKG